MLGSLFPFNKRLARGAYSVRLVVFLVIGLIVRGLSVAGMAQPGVNGLLGVFLLAWPVYVLLLTSTTIARLRDTRLSPWLALLLIVPGVNALMLLSLMFPPSRAIETPRTTRARAADSSAS